MKNLAFHLTDIRILGTRHYGNTRRESLKCCRIFQDVLCCYDYTEIVIASFLHQIQSEYYGINF